MKKRNVWYSLVVVLLSTYTFGQDLQKAYPESFTVKVINPLNTAREDVVVHIAPAQLEKQVKGFNPKAFVIVDKQGKEIAAQYNFQDREQPGIIAVLDKLNSGETRELTVRYTKTGEAKRTYTKRTQAELSRKTGGKWVNREYIGGTFENVEYLRVPPEHKDHSWFIRYEGPGWESDRVGYRFYLDQRNAADVFGKTTTDMVLQGVGVDGFDSYHKLQPWGMDVLKAGKSLGLGSIAALHGGSAVRVEKTDSVNSRITENGDVYSSILTNYYGWKVGDKAYTVQSELSIHAGTRITREQLTVTGNPDNLCTGIVKEKQIDALTSKGDATHYGYLATYGKQSLNGDNLGLAIFFKSSAASTFVTDEYNHLITLPVTKGKTEYYFLAAWDKEPNGIQDEQQFKAYLDKTARELAAPVRVEISKSKK